jgi:hypothetical protein
MTPAPTQLKTKERDETADSIMMEVPISVKGLATMYIALGLQAFLFTIKYFQ